MKRTFHIALLIDSRLGYCRRVLQGIQTYSIGKARWAFRDSPLVPEVVAPLREWKPDGVICHLDNRQMAAPLLALGVPLVSTSSTLADLKVHMVDSDHEAVGRMAAEYLIGLGYRHFAFFGSERAGFSRGREKGYKARLETAGFEVRSGYATYQPVPFHAVSWRRLDRQVERWLHALPKPVAIFACNDIRARHLTDACRQLGLNVPETVAVLGADNDEVECRFSQPPLSSVDTGAERIGYEAARLLDRLLERRRSAVTRIELPPAVTVARQSTDIARVDDPQLARALHFIHSNLDRDIGVNDIAREADLSRRTLERRFKKEFRRTVLDQVRDARVELAKQLLMETHLSVAEVAHRSGFANGRRFAIVFRRITGHRPTAYRLRWQVGRHR